MKLDLLRPEDLGDALGLSESEGWNQTAADWSRMLRLEPSGCFAASEGRRLVGTVTTTTYGSALAWIGMMVVHPDFRRQGIGEALMRKALDHLRGRGIERIKLDATPAGRPLYESLGFIAEAEFERWQGLAVAADPNALGPGDAREPKRFAVDQGAHGADRSRLLDLLAAEGVGPPLLLETEEGRGFALARPGRAAAYVGSLIATTAPVAAQLLNGMLTRLAGREVCLDLHCGGLLEPAALAERGFSKRRGLLRMHLGPRSDETPPSICASAGPEFG